MFLSVQRCPPRVIAPSAPGVAAIGGEKRDAQLIPTSRVMRKALVTKREGRVDRGWGRAPVSSAELCNQEVGINICVNQRWSL